MFYRVSKALEIARQAVHEIQEDDLPPSATPRVRYTYIRNRERLASLLNQLKPRVVDRMDLCQPYPFKINDCYSHSAQISRGASPELLLADNFFDGSLTYSNVNNMQDHVTHFLWLAMRSILEVRDFTVCYECKEVADEFISAMKNRPSLQALGLNQYFQFTDEVSLSYAQLRELQSKPHSDMPSMMERLNRARQIALTAARLKTAPTELVSILEKMRFDPILREDKGFEPYSGQHALNQQGEAVQFTWSMRYAHLDELTFILLHEAGHSLSLPFTGYKLEDKINSMAWDLVQTLQKNSAAINEEFKEDRKLIPLDLDEIKSRSNEFMAVRIFDMSVDGAPFLRVLPNDLLPRLESNEAAVDVPWRRVLLTCRWLGFESHYDVNTYPPIASQFKANTISELGERVLQTYHVGPDQKAYVYNDIVCSNKRMPYTRGSVNAGQ